MIKAIISDADGTLVNTLYLIRHGQYETAVEYLIERGIPRHDIPDYETYVHFINKSVGGSTRETFEKTIRMLFSETHEHHLKTIDFDEIDQRLAPVQDRIAPLYVHPFHGLNELFSWLGTSNTSLGIFTSGNRRMILRNFGVSLPTLGYNDLFRADEIPVSIRLESFIARTKAIYGIPRLAAVSCEDTSAAKPDPEGILRLMNLLQVSSDEVIVLGDHPIDMISAINAGIHAIGITHGFGTPAELKSAGAIYTIDNLGSIPQLIEDHNSGKNQLF